MVSQHPEKLRQSGEEAEIVEQPHQKPAPAPLQSQSTALVGLVPTPTSQSSTSTSTNTGKSTFQRRNLPPIDTSLAPPPADLCPKSKKTDNKMQTQTFQDAINESMQETKLMRESRIGSLEQESPRGQNVFMDTVNDLRSVASGTFTSIQKWAQSQSLDDLGYPTVKSDDNAGFVAPWPRPPPSPLMKATSEATTGMPKRSVVDGGEVVKPTNKQQSRDDSQSVERHTLLQDLTWPLLACTSEVAENLPRREQLSPHIKKVKDTVFKAVNGDMKGASELWKFSVFDKEDDLISSGSYDTLQEESNQIRRLASWNTVNTMLTTGTNGTYETGVSLGTEGSPVEIRIGVADDDGNAIDPFLLSKTQQTRDKRKPHRRERVVKFDYPPIKSLRTCPRPNPEDLPELFFTEIELDQIEDDRYSTMSTDDVEIVAVATKAPEHHAEASSSMFSRFNMTPKKGAKFADGSPSRHSAVDGRDPPEAGWRSSKGRASTPMPRRKDGDSDAQIASSMPPKSPKSSDRLVKGVQIYLRERSTGA
jgi:hypothetical protein